MNCFICGQILDTVPTRTISQQLEDVKNLMCDKYCKWPEKPIPEGKNEDWLWMDEASPCVNCPLNKL